MGDCLATDEQLELRNFDPLGDWLTACGLSPLTFALAVLLLNLSADVLAGWLFGVFSPGHTEIGLLDDYPALMIDLVSTPILCGLYLWSLKGASQMLREVVGSGVFPNRDQAAEAITKHAGYFESEKAFAGILVLSFAIAAIWFTATFGFKFGDSYLNSFPEMSFVRAPSVFLISYALLFGIFNVVVTSLALRSLFGPAAREVSSGGETIVLKPLHPDRCGGLAVISKFTSKIAYAIAILGLVISAATIFELSQHSWDNAYLVMAWIAGYVVLAPLLYFWPLSTAHQAMAVARERELKDIGDRFDAAYKTTKSGALNLDGDFEGRLRQLEELRNLYGIVEAFPVWPFDTYNLRRFAAIVSVPLVPALVAVAAELAKKA